MMGRQLALLCVFQFLACLARAEQEAPITDCDRYAATEVDQPKSGVPFEKIDPKIAIPACEEAVQMYPGSARLAFELGRAYLKKGDFDFALARFRQMAEEGYPPAVNSIGTMFLYGSGVPKNEGEAVNWFRQAAEQGYIPAQLNLGFVYTKGVGVQRDYAAALQWYRKSAARGSAIAQDSIGYFYGQGMGVKRDDAEAVAWFRKAADQGMAGAEYNLGTMYELGRGVPQDRFQALYWYRKSAEQGYEDAKKKLITLSAEENTSIPYPHPGADNSTSTLPSVPNTSQSNTDWPQMKERLDIARDKMVRCLQRFPKPRDNVEREIAKVMRGYVDSCGQDYMAWWRQDGVNEELSLATALVDAYKIMGCRYSNPTQIDLETTPEGDRLITCSP